MDRVPLGWSTTVKLPKPQTKDQAVGKPNRHCRVDELSSVGNVPIEKSINEHDDRRHIEEVDDRNGPDREPSDKAWLAWVSVGMAEGEKKNRDGFKHHHQPLWPEHNSSGQDFVQDNACEKCDGSWPPSNRPSLVTLTGRKDVAFGLCWRGRHLLMLRPERHNFSRSPLG